MAIQKEHILKGLEEFKQDFDVNKLLRSLSQFDESEYNKNFLAVYGSLREGEYNYKRIRNQFGKDSFFPICEWELTYSKLYDLGNFPAIIAAPWGNYVTAEIMYCNDAVFSAIEDMELGAGYTSAHLRIFDKARDITNKAVVIPYYIASPKLANVIRTNPKLYPLVKSGNWSEYIRNVIEA